MVSKKAPKKVSRQSGKDSTSITISVTIPGEAFLQALSNPALSDMYFGMMQAQSVGKKK